MTNCRLIRQAASVARGRPGAIPGWPDSHQLRCADCAPPRQVRRRMCVRATPYIRRIQFNRPRTARLENLSRANGAWTSELRSTDSQQ